MLHAAVIGVGPIGTTHLKALLEVEGVRVDYVVDTNLELAEARAREFGVEPLADQDDLPDEIDFVTIATPPATHCGIVRKALDGGFHVFCEKPLTLTLAETTELDGIALEADRHLGVGFKMRYEPWFAKAREVLGEIGDVYQVVTTKVQAFNGTPWIPATGAMQELSSHDFDLVHWIARARPMRMLSANLSYQRGWEAEDGFELLVEYDSGMLGSLNGWYNDRLRWNGRDSTMRFLGANGYLSIDRGERVVLHTDETQVFPFEGAPNTFRLELEAFARAIDSDEGEYPDGRAAIDSMWVVEEAYRLNARHSHP
jgi:scyllo-inositol 2-dehydrogenase (NAD+)